MKKLVTTFALLLWASQAWAQQSTQAGGTGCSTPATAARLGVMSPTIGTVCTITDGASATDCTTGGGTDKVTCFYCGAAWQSSSCGGASGGTDVALDLGDTGTNDSAAINEIATNGDTNNIFTEPAADKLLIDASQNWPACDVATAADDLSASCNQCVDISANTNLSVGAGLSLLSSSIGVVSNASGFLNDGGTTSLSCSAGTDGRIQVMDDGSLEWCDGAATSALQTTDNFVKTAGDTMTGDLTITDVAAGSVLTLTGLESEDTLVLASENATSPANNDSAALAMSVENSANAQVVGGRIFMQMVDVTSGSEDSQMSFQIIDDQSGNPITPLRFTNSSSGLPSVTVNPDLTDIDFIHWSAPAGGPVQTIACDAGTGVCNFANSPTVAGVADPTYVAVAGDAMTGQLYIDGGKDEVQLLIEGNATQTSRLLEIQNSAQSELAYIDQTGKVFTNGGIRTEALLDVNDTLDLDFTTQNAVSIYRTQAGSRTVGQAGCSGDGTAPNANSYYCNWDFISANYDSTTSTSGVVTYSQLRTHVRDNDAGTEDGDLEFLVRSNSGLIGMMALRSNSAGAKNVIVNHGLQDIDFRVYGSGTTDLLHCDASTGVCSFLNPPTGLSETTMTKFQTGAPGFNGVSTQETTGSAHCVKWFVPGRIADADTMDFVLSTGTGAAEVVELGTYSADGQTQYFECTVPTSSGTGSLNCSNDNATPAAIPPGDVWMCVTTSTGAVAFYSMHASTNAGRYCTFTQTVTAGELPDTLTSPSCTWTNLLPAYLGLSDE